MLRESIGTPPMTDFHNTSLDQKDYWEIQDDKAAALAIANLNPSNCWHHEGFKDYFAAVCASANKTMAHEYDPEPDYESRWEDGKALELILEFFKDGDTADYAADDITQGEAEQAYEDSISGEPPITLAEMHHAAWVRKQELNS